ncbi:MAG: PorV/PorQ family protein [Candidatus Cloacimonetes bacterium]|nr:PorV/PorQ family protein [Candidatus Cloacimonadota bacterium]
MKFKIILFILLVSASIFAINDNAGTSGFTFFKVNYSARAAAMGNAFTGLSNDASAVFFNPAGLIQLKSPQASVTYMSYFDGVQCGSAVYTFPKDDKTSFGFFAKGLTAKEDRTLADENGQYLGTDGTFGMSDIIFGISAARYVIDILDIGFSVKYLHENLDDRTGSAIAFDAGIMHQTTNENLKFGIVFRNFGWQLSYYTESKYEEKLPQLVTAGFSYHPDEKFYATLDIYKPLDFDFSGRIGLEYNIHKMLDLRAGYKSNAGDWKTGGENEFFSGMSFGTGFNLFKYNLKIDYAIISYGDLGFVNQVTVNYLF